MAAPIYEYGIAGASERARTTVIRRWRPACAVLVRWSAPAAPPPPPRPTAAGSAPSPRLRRPPTAPWAAAAGRRWADARTRRLLLLRRQRRRRGGTSSWTGDAATRSAWTWLLRRAGRTTSATARTGYPLPPASLHRQQAATALTARVRIAAPLANKTGTLTAGMSWRAQLISPLQKKCPFSWRDPRLAYIWFLGPSRVHAPNGISIGSAVYAGLTFVGMATALGR